MYFSWHLLSEYIYEVCDGICEYNDIWYHFSLWLTSLLVSWISPVCFLLALFLCQRYLLPITPMMVYYLFLAYSLILLNLLSDIFLAKHKLMLYFYTDLWLHEKISYLDKLHILSFVFTSFSSLYIFSNDVLVIDKDYTEC